MYYPFPPFPGPCFPYPGPWDTAATRSVAPAASTAGMTAIPSLVDYCPPWPPRPPWWPPVPPWPWPDMLNNMAMTRTAVAPSTVPVSPSTVPVPALDPNGFPIGDVNNSIGSSTQPSLSNGSIVLTETERSALTIALNFLKEHPEGKTTSPEESLRMATVLGFLTGFFEAKGLFSSALHAFIPSKSEQSSANHYDLMLNALDSMIKNTDTRLPPVAGAFLIGVAACAAWDGIKWAYNNL